MLPSFYATAGPNGFWVFLLLTVLAGGAASWRMSHAVAETWQPLWHALAYTALIAAAVRFLHFALFEEPLISPQSYAIDLGILLAIAVAGYRHRRSRQRSVQYPWTRRQAK